jgi:hypothetical protein
MQRFCLVLVAFAFLAAAPLRAQPTVVNGQTLDARTVAALQRSYGVVLPGSYWYDRVSGLWGPVGGPPAGQLAPGLALGRLREDASGGAPTGVFVNGRQIHPQELFQLRQVFGAVVPGRYWLAPSGIGGREGGPPQFDLRAAAPRGGGYIRRGPGGTIGSDGGCSYYSHPDGSSVMTGNC